MAAPVDKSFVDCYWFITSQCAKGEACEYRHCEAAKNNTTICKYWANGQCNNKACSFRHPSQVRTSTPCVFFLAGMCTKGDKCPYSHVGAPTDSTPPVVKPQETIKTETKSNDQPKPTTQQKDPKPKQTKASVPPTSKANQDSPQMKDQQKQKQTIKNVVKATVAGNTSSDAKKPASKASGPATTPQKQTTAPKKSNPPAKAKATKPPAKEAQPNFGIKSLDELIKEKSKDKPAAEPVKQEETNNNNINPNTLSNIDEIRKRNQQKFQTNNPQNTPKTEVTGIKRKADTPSDNNTSTTAPAISQPPTTPSKDLKISQDSIKKAKTTDTKVQTPTADATEDFDLDKELEQLGAEGLNDDDLDIDNIDVDNVDLDAIQT